MRVAVDAMGGDFAPGEVVKGALLVAGEQPQSEIILVGVAEIVAAELEKHGSLPANVHIRHAPEVIEMHDHPAAAIRRKRNSSLVLAGQMVSSGEADATISAGNTGAAMAIAILEMGRITGIDRPAIATPMPTPDGRFLLLDAGANVDCSSENLLQFALVGSIYAEKVMEIPRPRVGLLNIGGEPGKGNELAKETYKLLESAPLNFIGNVEGKDAFEGSVDVVVGDGFAGNVLLKSAEGAAELVIGLLHREITAFTDESMRQTMLPILHRLKQRIDYSEYGGGPLLGVNGVSVIGHGRSHAKAIANGIRAAIRAAESDFVGAIRATLPHLHEGAR